MSGDGKTADWPGSAGSSSTSSSLLERVKAREPVAWQGLVELYSPMIYRWCRQCGLQSDDSRDIGQEVFAAVAANLEGFRRDRPGASFRAWLWTIARNKIRDHFRRQKGREQAQGGTEAQQHLAQLPEDSPPSSTVTGQPSDEVSLVQQALAALRSRFDERTWQAFWRTTVAEESGTAVAADLGMSVQAVYQAKYRVLQRARGELDGLMADGGV